ncbi:hypothetical protein AB434_2663 [Heyndrickxia coagulans]|uniref:Uncharacterized protein n=1 Tax=Heyndrickxia coagulans TaxID=1398 RepID=A0AAN0T7U2_HEYCO|nr:hypothetical protein SB48_HM08orf04204 [Heyndrickxia coagulans]AKN55068.1 hypothetical protein AB434_2663 [Heyndrickxia coagulans]
MKISYVKYFNDAGICSRQKGDHFLLPAGITLYANISTKN